LIFSSLNLLPPPAVADEGIWIIKSPMPTARFASCSGVLGGEMYVVGGMGGVYGNTFSVNATEAYDPDSDTWSTKAILPTSRWGLACGVFNGKLYAVGGMNESGTLDVVEVYDPIADAWDIGTPLPVGRAYSGAAVIDGKVYVLGGSLDGGSTATGEVVVYDPVAEIWSYGPSLGIGKQAMGVATYGGEVYLFGSYRGAANAERYDPLGTPQALSPLPYGVTAPGAATVGGFIYIAGGSPAEGYRVVGLVYTYDIASDMYMTASPMAVPASHPAVSVLGDKMYAIGGFSGQVALDATQEFTPPQSENLAPTCSITNLDNEQTVQGLVQIEGLAADQDGQVVRIDVDIDGFGWNEATGTTSWNYSWDTTDAKPGYHTVHARAYDGQEYSTHYWIVVEIPQPETVAEDELLIYALLGVVIFLILMVLGLFLARQRSRR